MGGCFLNRILPLRGIGRSGRYLSVADGQNAPPPHIKIDFLVQPYLVGGSAGSSLVEPGHSVREPVHLRVGTAVGMDGLQLDIGSLCPMAYAKGKFG